MGRWCKLMLFSMLKDTSNKTNNEHKEHAEYDVCPAARYWEKQCYHDYMRMHGKHFSKKMAEWAVSKNQWSDGKGAGEYWTCEQVKTALSAMGITLADENKYDAYYLANTMYADHASATMTDVNILQLVKDIMNDNDGYPGMIWDMWSAKAMGHCWEIPFQDLM